MLHVEHKGVRGPTYRKKAPAYLAHAPSRSESLTVRLVAPDCLHASHDRVSVRVQGGLERFTKNSACSAADLYTKKGRGVVMRAHKRNVLPNVYCIRPERRTDFLWMLGSTDFFQRHQTSNQQHMVVKMPTGIVGVRVNLTD